MDKRRLLENRRDDIHSRLTISDLAEWNSREAEEKEDARRRGKLSDIEKDIMLLHGIQRSLADMVNKQGEMLNECEANTIDANVQAQTAELELGEADRLSKKLLFKRLVAGTIVVGAVGGFGIIPLVGMKTGLTVAGTSVGTGVGASFLKWIW